MPRRHAPWANGWRECICLFVSEFQPWGDDVGYIVGRARAVIKLTNWRKWRGGNGEAIGQDGLRLAESDQFEAWLQRPVVLPCSRSINALDLTWPAAGNSSGVDANRLIALAVVDQMREGVAEFTNVQGRGGLSGAVGIAPP